MLDRGRFQLPHCHLMLCKHNKISHFFSPISDHQWRTIISNHLRYFNLLYIYIKLSEQSKTQNRSEDEDEDEDEEKQLSN